MTDTLLEIVEATELFPYEEDNDPRRRTHIFNPPSNLHIWKQGMSGQDVVDIARLNGLEIIALCGYTWIPKHNPEKYDVCEPCFKVAAELMRHEHNR